MLEEKNLYHENTKLQKHEKQREIIMLSYHKLATYLLGTSKKSVETATRPSTQNPPIPLCKGGALSGFHLLANEAADKRPRALLRPLLSCFRDYCLFSLLGDVTL